MIAASRDHRCAPARPQGGLSLPPAQRLQNENLLKRARLSKAAVRCLRFFRYYDYGLNCNPHILCRRYTETFKPLAGLPAAQALPSQLALGGGLSQRLVGVGLQLADPFDGSEDLVVVAPIPNSPAEVAGIQPLDRLLRIDDLDVRKYRLTAGEGTNLLRGWEGTEVKVLIQRARSLDGSIPLDYDALGDRLPRQRPFEALIGDGMTSSAEVENGKIEEIVLQVRVSKIPCPPLFPIQ